jgi:hypothetical protein
MAGAPDGIGRPGKRRLGRAWHNLNRLSIIAIETEGERSHEKKVIIIDSALPYEPNFPGGASLGAKPG